MGQTPGAKLSRAKLRRAANLLAGDRARPAPNARLGRWILLAASLLAGCLVAQAILRYLALSSTVMDLGIFMAALDSVAQEPTRALSGHVWPLMPLWGAAYQSLPEALAPVALVGSQAVILVGTVAAVWRVFGAWAGAAMLLYAPLWSNALFDFHFDHLAVPLLAAFFIFCERRRFVAAALAAAALVLVKEPFALQTIACGLYLGWLALARRGEHERARLLGLGVALILFGGLWFVGATHWVLPYFTVGESGLLSQSSPFRWLGTNLPEILWTLMSRPDIWLLEIIQTPPKLLYLALVFGLLGFIPLLRPAALLVALPPLAIALLSREGLHHYYGSHYTAGLIVPCIVAFRDGLPVARRYWSLILNRTALFAARHFARAQPGRLRAWASPQRFSVVLAIGLLIGHWSFASSPASRLFWSESRWALNGRVYWPTSRDAMIKAALERHIPHDRNIAVATQNSLNWSSLAHRTRYVPFPIGVLEPHPGAVLADRGLAGLWQFIRTGDRAPTQAAPWFVDYVVLDLKRPWFVVDRGCRWRRLHCPDQAIAAAFLTAVADTKLGYATVFTQDAFMILRRDDQTQALDAPAARPWGMPHG